MQPTIKTRNKNTTWSALLKPRVGDTVLSGGRYYVNTSGRNAAVTDGNNWQQLTTIQQSFDRTFTADDVEGADPDFYIDLTPIGAPAFLLNLVVYVKATTSGSWQMVAPAQYDPDTRLLHGMNNPADFPDMLVRVMGS